MKKLKHYELEDIKKISDSYERGLVLDNYHKWLKKVRKQEKRELYHLEHRIYNHKHKWQKLLKRSIRIDKTTIIEFVWRLTNDGNISENIRLK